MKKMKVLITLTAIVLVVFVCFVSCSKHPPINPERPTEKGFIAELDESSARGKLMRVTPPDMDVRWKFAVSPVSKSVVFSGKQVESSEPYQLYRIDIGSDAPVKITSGGDEDCWDPSFTLDGDYIVYRSAGSFWKIPKDGSGARVKIQGSGLNTDYYPEVSSTGKLAFVTFNALTNRFLIWTIGLDGSELTQYREGNFPKWSHDGNKIVFNYDDDIWMMDASGKELTQMTSTEGIQEALPSFSPDGEYIAYVSNEGLVGVIEDVNIWTSRTNGRGKTQITALKSWDSWPVWTEDGIYFLSGRAKGKKDIVRIWLLKN